MMQGRVQVRSGGSGGQSVSRAQSGLLLGTNLNASRGQDSSHTLLALQPKSQLMNLMFLTPTMNAEGCVCYKNKSEWRDVCEACTYFCMTLVQHFNCFKTGSEHQPSFLQCPCVDRITTIISGYWKQPYIGINNFRIFKKSQEEKLDL